MCAGREPLLNAIYKYVEDFSPGVSRDHIKKFVAQASIIILDGCDESSRFGQPLASDITQLTAMSLPRTDVPLKILNELPEAIRSKFTIDRKKKQGKLNQRLLSHELKLLSLLSEKRGWQWHIEDFITQCNEAQRIILTSRPSSHFDLPKSFRAVSLSPFDDRQLNNFYRELFSETPSLADEVIAYLDDNHHIKDVCRTPIVAMILGGIKARGYSLPRSKTDLYTKRFQLLLEEWDTSRGVRLRNRITSSDKTRFLSDIALMMHKEHRREIPIERANEVWRNTLRQHYPSLSFGDILEELFVSNTIIDNPSSGTVSLGHLSYQEYLCAVAIRDRQGSDNLKSEALSDWWREVITFYVGLTGDATAIVDHIVEIGATESEHEFVQRLLKEARFTKPEVANFASELLSDDEEREDY